MIITSRPARPIGPLTLAQHELVEKEIEMIAGELRQHLSPGEKGSIKCTPREDLVRFRSTLGRAIRNEYELWMDGHHITAIYHDAGGCDGHHPCHPDNFSMTCIERLWEKLQ